VAGAQWTPAEEVSMTDDDEPAIHFTDEEAAFLRYVRFGELPARVPPQEWVELTETDPRRDAPETRIRPDVG
jgi:hypothetical protein